VEAAIRDGDCGSMTVHLPLATDVTVNTTLLHSLIAIESSVPVAGGVLTVAMNALH